jgi:hypothetical protein
MNEFVPRRASGRIGYLLALSGVAILFYKVLEALLGRSNNVPLNDAEIWVGVALSLVLIGVGTLLMALELKEQHAPLKLLRHARYPRTGRALVGGALFSLGIIAIFGGFIAPATRPGELGTFNYVVLAIGLIMLAAGVAVVVWDTARAGGA